MTSVIHPDPAAVPYAVAVAPPAAHDVRTAVRAWWNACPAGEAEDDLGVSGSRELTAAWRSVYAGVLGDEQLDILDVGCGTGGAALLLHEMGHIVSGVDSSSAMVRAALARARACGVHQVVELCVGDAECLPYPDASFDVVHVRSLLWTLPDPARAAAEWARVLRPGGRVVVIESRWGGAYDGLLRRIARAVRSDPPARAGERPAPPRYPSRDHFRFYGGLTGGDVAQFLRSAGFREPTATDLGALRSRARASLPWRARMLARGVRDDSLTCATRM